MEDKKEYTPEEVAEGILQRAKEVLQEQMDKSSPENKNFAQAAELNVPQPKAPQATEKVIAKRPLELKNFAQRIAVKKALK